MPAPRTALGEDLGRATSYTARCRKRPRVAALAEAGQEDAGLLGRARRPSLHRPPPRARGDLRAGLRGLRLAGRKVRRPGPDARDRRPQRADGRPRPAVAGPAVRSASGTSSARTRRSSASPISAIDDRRQGIVHVIGPEQGLTPAGHDDRLRRQPHLDARRPRRPGLRHRHLRGRARARHPDAAAGATRRPCQSQVDGALARRRDRQGRDPGDHQPHRRGRRHRSRHRVSRRRRFAASRSKAA